MKHVTAVLVVVLLSSTIMVACAQQQGQATKPDEEKQHAGFIDHGVLVPLAERHGAIGLQDKNGHNIVIACVSERSPRAWILVTDIDTGKTQQICVPEGIPHNWDPYGSLLARTGKFYTSIGAVLVEFDPTLREWTFHGRPSTAVSCYFRIIEGPDGTIWAGGPYRTTLISFDPKTKEMKDHGRMDDIGDRISYLAVDDAGWVYCGTSVARWNIVAYNPQTGEKRQIPPDEDLCRGNGWVQRGTDGKAYGKRYGRGVKKWYRMYAGEAEVIDESEVPPKADQGDFYWGIVSKFPDGRKLTAYSTLEKYMDIYDPNTGLTRRIKFDYETVGAPLRVLTGGPDGKIYTCSCHPGRVSCYDPETDELKYYPGHISLKGIDVQGKYVFGGMYTGGKVYLFDTTKPWNLVPEPPTLMDDGIPAAELLKAGETQDGKLVYVEDYDLVLFMADDYGGKADFKLAVPEDGKYNVFIATNANLAFGWCDVEFLLDGETIGKRSRISTGSGNGFKVGPVLTLGPVDLKAGEHRLTLQTIKGGEAEQVAVFLKRILLTRKQPDEVISKPGEQNPELVIASCRPDINVPWEAFAHPDGKHILVSGNPGYGLVGGGIAIYNLETGETLKLTHKELIENHSTLGMQALPNGDIIASTSVGGGTGGVIVATEAVIYILDWETKKVKYQTVPIPGLRSLRRIKMGPDGLLYCFGGSIFFVFDPASKEVVHQQDLDEFGGACGVELGPDGHIYVAFNKAIAKITPGSFEVEKIADPPGPIKVGLALVKGRAYFVIGTHLWSVKI